MRALAFGAPSGRSIHLPSNLSLVQRCHSTNVAAAGPHDRSFEEISPTIPQTSQQNGNHERDQASTRAKKSAIIPRKLSKAHPQQAPSSGRLPKKDYHALPRSRKKSAKESVHAGSSSSKIKQRLLVIKDEQWVRENLNIPTADQYPSAPKTLFIDGRNARRTIEDMTRRGELKIERNVSEIGPPFLCRITCTFHENTATINVTGEGRSKVYRPSKPLGLALTSLDCCP